ncbi:hypothetical protein [Bacteroides sp.]|uniref:hypothetical protein n=1 Tax=Bacteroides sp. TaxID=29523 RepID=UPI0026256E97|nr:hypothetical protein [Bacteroides sp.]MDD3038277.1 hypothetical protein [Bacteroides sp.]
MGCIDPARVVFIFGIKGSLILAYGGNFAWHTEQSTLHFPLGESKEIHFQADADKIDGTTFLRVGGYNVKQAKRLLKRKLSWKCK